MGRVHNSGGLSIVSLKDGVRTVWSTESPPVNLLPEANWFTATPTIAFPDFSKFCNYAYQRVFNADGDRPPWSLSGSGDVCQTVTMIDELQSWIGPDIYLGSVPAGTNYIDVRVKLYRTKAPNNLLDQPVYALLGDGQLAHLPGGSCEIEATSVWRRLFTVVLDGTSVILKRKQNVASIPLGYSGIYNTVGSTSDPYDNTSSTPCWGWVAGPGGDYVGTQRNGHPAALIQVKEYSSNSPSFGTPSMGAKHQLRGNACSVDVSQHDFSSSYNSEITIRPGYMKP